MSSISSAMPGIRFQPSEPRLNVTVVWAAWPSFDGMGPMTLPSTSSIAWSSVACSFMVARSAGENPSSFS